jgi:hypothetical protein
MLGCGRLDFEQRSDASMDTATTDVGPDGALAIASYTVTPPSFSTTSTSYVEVPGSKIVVPASPGQKWLLLVSGALQSTSLEYSAADARYLVDGVERGRGGTEAIDVGRPGPWQHVYMFDGASVPTTIVFELRDNLGMMTTLDQLRAVVVPIPSSADPQFVSDDMPPEVTSVPVMDAVQLTVTPSTPGEYLLLVLANASEAPTTGDIDTQWLDALGNAWSRGFKNPRGSLQSLLLVRRATLSGASTFTLQAGSGGGGSTLAYVRIVALRIAGLSSFEEVTSTTLSMTTSATPATVNTLTPVSAAGANRYLVLGTTRIDDDCGNTLLAARGIHFTVDGTVHSVEHTAGNCASEMTYGYVGLHDTRPASVSIAMSSGKVTNEIVVHRESTLFMFGVP